MNAALGVIDAGELVGDAAEESMVGAVFGVDAP